MKRFHRLSLLVAASLPIAAGGCSPASNRGVESVNQPVVNRTDYAIDLATRGADLRGGEAARLSGWLDGLRLGYGDRVAIDDPAQGAAARDRIAAPVADRGLLLTAHAPVTAWPIAPGTLRVVVSRMSASVPGCPDWSRAAGSYLDQAASSNYGCAVNSNLAAMVASPGDLVQGASGSGNDTAASYKAIDTYRKAVPTGTGGLPGGVTSVSVTKGGN